MKRGKGHLVLLLDRNSDDHVISGLRDGKRAYSWCHIGVKSVEGNRLPQPCHMRLDRKGERTCRSTWRYRCCSVSHRGLHLLASQRRRPQTEKYDKSQALNRERESMRERRPETEKHTYVSNDDQHITGKGRVRSRLDQLGLKFHAVMTHGAAEVDQHELLALEHVGRRYHGGAVLSTHTELTSHQESQDPLSIWLRGAMQQRWARGSEK